MKAVTQTNKKGRGNGVQSGPIGAVNNKGALFGGHNTVLLHWRRWNCKNVWSF
jgi:hypothetical protein